MPLEEVRRALRSAERNVLVEAPAGCGKTFQAAELAADLANDLAPGAEVLLLAHTNAAVQEFVRRTRASGARVRATTIDAFCLDLLTPYAARLNLPTPLRRAVGFAEGGVPFRELAPAAASLLLRCPSIASALAYRHPVVILDEHQDASVAQHEISAALNRCEHCRVRVFADPMQAIYEEADQARISWDRLSHEAGTFVELDEPQRWTENRELGEWILLARRELAAGRPLPIAQRPASVRVTRAEGIDCANFGYGNAGQLAVPINRFLNNLDGTVAVLARRRRLIWTLHEAARHRLLFNEGADYQDAYSVIARAVMHDGNAQQLALLLVEHLREVSSGVTRAIRDSIARALQVDHIDCGRQRVLRPFIERFQPLYAGPTIATFCRVAGNIAFDPPQGVRIRMPMTLRLLGRIHPGTGDALECLDEAVGRAKALAWKPERAVSTIHKAKGLEFDHVMIANFSDAHFGDDDMARRVAYVAISRARQSLEFLVPGRNPSPLLGR